MLFRGLRGYIWVNIPTLSPPGRFRIDLHHLWDDHVTTGHTGNYICLPSVLYNFYKDLLSPSNKHFVLLSEGVSHPIPVPHLLFCPPEEGRSDLHPGPVLRQSKEHHQTRQTPHFLGTHKTNRLTSSLAPYIHIIYPWTWNCLYVRGYPCLFPCKAYIPLNSMFFFRGGGGERLLWQSPPLPLPPTGPHPHPSPFWPFYHIFKQWKLGREFRSIWHTSHSLPSLASQNFMQMTNKRYQIEDCTLVARKNTLFSRKYATSEIYPIFPVLLGTSKWD